MLAFDTPVAQFLGAIDVDGLRFRNYLKLGLVLKG